MGPTVHSKVPVGTYPNPIPVQTTPRDLVLRRGAHKIITGDQRIPDQGCNCRSPDVHKQLHISDFPVEKERVRTEAGHIPDGPQQLCEIRALQNGRDPCIT